MPITYWIAALAVAASLALGAGLWFTTKKLGAAQVELQDTKDALDAAQETSKKLAAVSVFRENLRVVAATKRAAQMASVAAAVASAPVWASEEVPKEVQDALAAP